MNNSLAKQEWKKFYRTLRVIRRESLKVVKDAMLYGTGFMHFPEDGSDVECIHPSKIQLTEDGEILKCPRTPQ